MQGFFFGSMLMGFALIRFEKKALGSKALVQKFVDRGLILQGNDETTLFAAFDRIGYYRLTGFCLPFQFPNKPNRRHFRPGTTLAHILSLYDFDTELRALAGIALEKIEVAVRTSICDHMSRTHGAHWYMNVNAFLPGAEHASLLEKAARSVQFNLNAMRPFQETPDKPNPHLFLTHYYSKYNPPAMPASWMLRECASFGFWAQAYENLLVSDQKQIADAWRFPSGKRVDHALLGDWLWSISVFRNRCAHHARITHRSFPFAPSAPAHDDTRQLFGARTDNLRTLLVVIAILLKSAAPSNMWRDQLRQLVDRYHGNVDIERATGFGTGKANWREDPLWTWLDAAA